MRVNNKYFLKKDVMMIEKMKKIIKPATSNFVSSDKCRLPTLEESFPKKKNQKKTQQNYDLF